jgi:hypothetical protein
VQSLRRGTLDECEAYAVSLGLPASDGEAFFRLKEARNWTANGKPMVDWRKDMVSWKTHEYHPSQKTNVKSSPSSPSSKGNRNIGTANEFVPHDAYDISKRATRPDDADDDKPY